MRGNTHGLVVFTNLLAHADSEGWVDIHPRAIADETGLTVEQVNAAINQLESPDPDSRSPEESGKRIILLDEHRSWGWIIVNYKKYRSIRSEEDRREQNRLAQQRFRDKRNQSKPRKPMSAQAEAEAEAEAEERKAIVPSDAGRPICPHEKIIELYHQHLPTMPAVRVWTEPRKKKLIARWREDVERQDLDYWERFFKYVAKSDFLCGRTTNPFTCDLEWMLNSSNFVKIVEGKYHAA